LLLGLGILAVDVAPCSHPRPPPDSPAAKAPSTADASTAAAPAAKPAYDKLARLDFNRRAAERFLPLFWRTDANKNGALEPDELAFLWGYGSLERETLIGKDGFTDAFAKLYASLLAPDEKTGTPEEQKRRDIMRLELSQGRTTLLETDFSTATDEDKAIATHLAKAAVAIERLYAHQMGTIGMAEKIPEGDTASRMVFYRNQEPQCVAPKTEKDPDCSALADKPKRIVGLYPADIQSDPKFCDMLAKQPNSKELMDHFTAVVAGDKPGTFKAVPYAELWKDDMEAVAKELDATAAAITSPGEAPLKAYLTAQAKAFRTNDWESANEPWAAMGVDNSKWYVRIAPDEVYYEPCAWKAGFAAVFARINPESVTWQKKLDPVKNDMEKALAAMAGPPYKARDVKFKVPDFIDIVLNAGNARDAHGATIGESLPNWGKVAERGGRTVSMTNLYTDEDSRAAGAEQMASMFCKATNAKATTDSGTLLVTTMLHEAAHNLGPAHEYKVKGKVDDAVFGGPLASTLEELKAQTSALYFTDWIAERGLLEKDKAIEVHVRDVAWAFGHISRGMYSGTGQAKPYSQLASIQLGSFWKGGALKWNADEVAANGTDKGCFEIDFAKMPVEVKALATRVLKIKGSGDKKDAEALKAQWVDAKDDWAKMRDVITERWLRAPKASFVYAVKQ
jgi:hypothetical protein